MGHHIDLGRDGIAAPDHDQVGFGDLAPVDPALRADPGDGELALRLFRSNRTCGLLVFLGLLAVGLSNR